MTNAFASTFYFLQHTSPILKNKKSLQATTQGQCIIRTERLRGESSTTANKGLAKVAAQWLIEHLCFVSNVVLTDGFVLRIRHLRQAPNR